MKTSKINIRLISHLAAALLAISSISAHSATDYHDLDSYIKCVSDGHKDVFIQLSAYASDQLEAIRMSDGKKSLDVEVTDRRYSFDFVNGNGGYIDFDTDHWTIDRYTGEGIQTNKTSGFMKQASETILKWACTKTAPSEVPSRKF